MYPLATVEEVNAMLAKSTVLEVDRLLKQGKLSQRKIAARLGVSRASVAAIASGRRGLHGKESADVGKRSKSTSGPPQRCPTCGHRVYLPCLICQTQQYQQFQRLLRMAGFSKARITQGGRPPKTQRRAICRHSRLRSRPARARCA